MEIIYFDDNSSDQSNQRILKQFRNKNKNINLKKKRTR